MYKKICFRKFYNTVFHFSSLANKQDREEALDKNAIVKNLELEQFVNDNPLCRVVKLIEPFLLQRKFVD
jgi:hypothetical protein